LSRTTASTQMNSQSSHSHAIFTLHIKQQRMVIVETIDDGGSVVSWSILINKYIEMHGQQNKEKKNEQCMYAKSPSV